MQSKLLVFVVGLIVGFIVMGILVWNIMPKMMLNVHKSSLDFDSTVTKLNEKAEEFGWHVPKIYDIQQSLISADHEDMTRLKILSLCKPDYAYKILMEDGNKKVSAIMPCRIGVYETSAGEVYVSEMNIGLMSKMFGGTIEEVMSLAAEEENNMIVSVKDNSE